MRSRKYSFRSLSLPDTHRGARYRVFGASNGLILFGLVEYLNDGDLYAVRNIYYLCNPMTGESIRLPSPRTCKFVTRNYGHWGPALVARVNENDVLESYRIVLLLPYKEGEYLRAIVYASETLEWEEFILPCEIPSEHIYNLLTTLNNQILHWCCAFASIIAYDPYANPDRIRIIARPPLHSPLPSPCSSYCSRMCNASGGKLRYFEKLTIETEGRQLHSVWFKLWVLDDSSGTWCLSHESDDSSIGVASGKLIKNLAPMYFDPLDGDIVYLADSHTLLSYDFRTREVEVLEEYAHGRRSNDQLNLSRLEFWFVEPLPWPISINIIPCSSSATATTIGVRSLLMRGVHSLLEKFLNYLFYYF